MKNDDVIVIAVIVLIVLFLPRLREETSVTLEFPDFPFPEFSN